MQLSKPLRGIIPPVVTPLLGRDELDHAGLARLVRRMLDAGCSGLFVLGSTGEAQALSYRLRLELVREVCRLANGRVPVLAGITDTSIVEAIELGNRAMQAGASALVTAPPYYFRLSQADLLRHAETLAGETGAPLFLYNMPGLTKLTYEAETVAAAAQIENIVGFKDSSGDLIYLKRVMRLLDREDFTVLIGPEELLGQALLMGVHGGIAGGANLQPDLYVALYEAACARDLDELTRLERRVMEVSENVYRIGDPATSYFRGLKCALGIQGICSELPAPPLGPFRDGEKEQLRQWLNQFEAQRAPVAG